MFEKLRIEKLIEEREAYENVFFSSEDILKSEELDFTISQCEYCQEVVIELFDYEDILIEPFQDYFEELRDEKLIKEREAYEIDFFKNFSFEVIKKDTLDILIESYEEHDCPQEFDFEIYPPNDCFLSDWNTKPEFINRPSCGCDLDYMPHDDHFDYLECNDYPEGPNENLWGVIH